MTEEAKSPDETSGSESLAALCYVNICERCKFIQYEDGMAYCGQGHWSGDDDPENPPANIVDDPWADCEDFET